MIHYKHLNISLMYKNNTGLFDLEDDNSQTKAILFFLDLFQ